MDEKDDKGSDGKDVKENEQTFSKAELRRRKIAVGASKALFRSIDVLFDAAQNSCPYISKEEKASIRIEHDIPYCDCGSPCTLDRYYLRGVRPAIILIHGGGFSAGDKKYRRGLSKYLALKGYSVFCVNYGLAPKFVYPEPLKHLVKAVNFVFDNAEKFDIDREKIIFSGDSAGAYYAAMLAALDKSEMLKKEIGATLGFRPLGLLLNCGLYDIDTVLDTKYLFDVDDHVFLAFLGIRKRDFASYSLRDECMPCQLVTPDFPPSFLIYSDYDFFCKGHAQKLMEKLDGAGVYYESYGAKRITSNHCFSLDWHGDDAVSANELMLSFAERLVSGKIKA